MKQNGKKNGVPILVNDIFILQTRKGFGALAECNIRGEVPLLTTLP